MACYNQSHKNEFAIIATVVFLFYAKSHCFADGGFVPIMKRGYGDAGKSISIYEVSQKAIIAWGKNKEIMILSVDAHAEKETRALHIIPFPSLPSVKKSSFDLFIKLNQIIDAHNPFRDKGYSTTAGYGRGIGGYASSHGDFKGITIIFNKKIGIHDITTIRADNYHEFARWIKYFIKKQGIKSELESLDSQDIKNVIMHYVVNGIKYFVVDIVDLSTHPESIEPLLFEFESPYLWYPLHISTLNQGDTSMQLIFITEDMPALYLADSVPLRPSVYSYRYPVYYNLDSEYYNFDNEDRLGHFIPQKNYGNISEFKFMREETKSILFAVTKEEIDTISTDINALFTENAYMGAFEYKGNFSNLKWQDIKKSAFKTAGYKERQKND